VNYQGFPLDYQEEKEMPESTRKITERDLVRKAREFATGAHQRIDQRRKYTNQPYEVHLKSVAKLAASVTDDTEMVAAAWLHDTVEDTQATIEDIEREFGARVAQLVSDLTDVSRPGDGNRARRKSIDLAHTAEASARAKTIKLADLIDNCRDICKHDEGFGRIYLGEALALMEILREGDARLYRQAERTIEKCAAAIGFSAAAKAPPVYDTEEVQASLNLNAAPRKVLRLFTKAFTAQDIAEPLRSFDEDLPADSAANLMSAKNIEVAGVRADGLVCGYLLRTSLGEGCCRVLKRSFAPGQVVDADSSLTDVIQVLTRHDWCFVNVLGTVSGVVGRSDMQKPIVRMWLFGIITLIEIKMSERIQACWPDNGWKELVSPERLRMAENLQEERQRRNQTCILLDCLQLPDKAQILMQDPAQLEEFEFKTIGAAKRVIKDLESLRNNLAHAQDIVSYDWPQIARMARTIEKLAGGEN
jgi:hypothetical protein